MTLTNINIIHTYCCTGYFTFSTTKIRIYFDTAKFKVLKNVKLNRQKKAPHPLGVADGCNR